ncbi:hypothetical protein TIFTF001_029325 [Ficus carica]|uniref:Uncharacterized protein n=1 Tax=Ficus carica TaxID=3494 RepID=A0AA88DRA7_FICCA|nr:hypothetical protein TIFTF001_029325 [Ficus carica]
MASTIHHSKVEYEFHQSRKGAEMSNEASERSRPATKSGAGVLSIPQIARLNKPPHRLRVDTDFRTKSNFTFPFRMNERTPCQRDGSGSDEAGVELSVDDILTIYYPQENLKDHGRYSMYPRRKKQVLNKPPPKALLFEEKLERLLALPNREWDEINISKRLRASSLWKDFVELKTELALDTMKVGFPDPKGLLAKKKAQKEAAKAAAAEKTARGNEPPPLPVIESSPEPPSMPVRSPAKKRKAGEKLRLKTQEKGTSLLQIRDLSVEVMRQLLSDVDLDTINDGRIHSHLDDLLWDGLKSNLLALGLIYRTTDKVVEQKKLIKELKDKDKDHREKLLNIERKFKNIKASANDLIAELQKVTQSAKEGTDMMKVMVDRFDEAQAKIKTLEADNFALITQIVDAYEKATLKARYDL